jgi:CBS domain-containing protein
MDSGLIQCPFCDAEVIQGADHCDECGQSLANLHLPVPASEVELALLTDRVHIFQGRPALVISASMPVREAIRLLAYNKIGCLVVVETGEVAGIFTERDVLMKVNDQLDALGDHPVSEFMTTRVETLPLTAKVAFAVHRMDLGGFRHIPLVNERNEPIGVFSVRDILRYLQRKMESANAPS